MAVSSVTSLVVKPESALMLASVENASALVVKMIEVADDEVSVADCLSASTVSILTFVDETSSFWSAEMVAFTTHDMLRNIWWSEEYRAFALLRAHLLIAKYF